MFVCVCVPQHPDCLLLLGRSENLAAWGYSHVTVGQSVLPSEARTYMLQLATVPQLQSPKSSATDFPSVIVFFRTDHFTHVFCIFELSVQEDAFVIPDLKELC